MCRIALHRNTNLIGAKSVPKTVLTDIAIKKFPAPEAGTRTYWDGAVKGLGLRLSQGGARTFIVLIGSGRRQALGRYPTISLADARTEAKRILAEKTLGKVRPTHVAFDDAKDQFLAECGRKNKPRTVSDYTRHLRRHYRFGRTSVGDIKPQELVRRLSKLNDTPSEKHHAFVVGRAFFRWCVQQHYIDRSPMESMRVPPSGTPRDRVLTEAELTIVLKAARDLPCPFGPIAQLLILTGQRRGEVAALEWDWIDSANQTITIPSQATKNKRTHTFPYGRHVERLLDELLRTGKYLFPASREHVRGKPTSVFNGWPKCTEQLRERCGIDHFNLHDLRRTFSSTLAALGTPIHVTEKLLNHVSGTVSGVAAVYNRHTYIPEMREAIAVYEDYIEMISNKD